MLEELAITVQQQLLSSLPFCAFNGGNDVFVDVGNKSIGLDALMRFIGAQPGEVRHAVGAAPPVKRVLHYTIAAAQGLCSIRDNRFFGRTVHMDGLL